MKKLMTGIAQNLSSGAEHATMVVPGLFLVMSLGWFNDKPFLFWSTIPLASLMVIGIVIRQFQK